MLVVTHEYLIEAAPHDLPATIPKDGWFLVRVPIREERRVIERLKQLDGCEYLIIWDNATRHYSRSRKRLTTNPLLPGYVFVRSQRHERHDLFDHLRPVQELSDMRDHPDFSQELKEFCQLTQAAGGDITQRKGYAKGTLVEVVDGPLAGCRGRIVRENGTWEITVGLSIFGTTVASSIEITCVQEIEGSVR
jgi:transcription antitermination factor NusG